MLHQQAPRFWELSQVVGQWVSIQFQEKQPPQTTAGLTQLGFHWNRKRQVWQHPCGHFATGSHQEPRQKYPAFFPAD